MNLINEKVHHHQFGEGIVTSQVTDTITIQFSEEYGCRVAHVARADRC